MAIASRSDKGRIDWPIVLLYLALVLIGWVCVYSAVYNDQHSSIFDISQRYGKQLVWILTSVAIALAILVIDNNFFTGLAYPIYGLFMFALLLVLVFGTNIQGQRAWFTIGNFAIQPSEFGKFATSLALAKCLSMPNHNFKDFKVRALSATIIILPALLILAENDTGSALIYATFVFVLFREGLSGIYLFWGGVAIVLFIATLLLGGDIYHLPFKIEMDGQYLIVICILLIMGALLWMSRRAKKAWPSIVGTCVVGIVFVFSVGYIFNKILEPHQRNRIEVLLGVKQDPLGAGYNVHQSLIAIGSGGFTGKGFLQGTLTKYNYVPEQSTDFIFCTIGEEWGFLGTTLVVLLFMALIIRIIIVAERQKATFPRVYGYCVASVLFIHVMINIGMVIGLMPVIGVPLPFISYGGSSLWAFTILLFIFVKLDREKMQHL